MSEPIILVVSVDTEEDNWTPTRQGITVENVRQLERLDRHLEDLGVRATYLTTYQVATTPASADVIRALAATGRAEVGAHLHPWNTPPLSGEITPASTMMSNLPLETQIAKTEVLTSALADLLGKRPVVFRAGRWGLDRSTAAAIVQCGYRVDCSVTPGRSWRESLGATHVGAPYDVYRMDPSRDHRIPVPGGALAEVPVSWGYTQRNWTLAHHINVLLDWPVLRRSRASRVGALLHLVNHAVLSPEIEPVDDMFRLVRQLLAKGVRHLHLTLHSSSLLPGLSPFTPTAGSVELVYERLGQILDRISRLTPLRFATVGEAASLLAPAVAAPS